MKYLFYPDLELLAEILPYKDQWDFLIDLEGLSRFGQTSLEEAFQLQDQLEKKFTLEWDALQTDHEISHRLKIFKKSESLFNLVRLLDPGMSHLFEQDIELILDQGHCNLLSIKSWERFFGSRLKKIILSSQLSSQILKNYIEQIKTPKEILVFGKILIFHSPRYLLDPQKEKAVDLISSNETHHKNFYFFQGPLGTSMFSPKILSLLPYLEEFSSLETIRIDLRNLPISTRRSLYHYLFCNQDLQIEEPTFTGFYHQNKTHVLFSKLKNQNLKPNPLAKVIGREKGSYLALEIFKNLSVDEEITLITPEGREFSFKIQFLEKISPKIALINDQGVPTESLLYSKNFLHLNS